ncbi:MAG: hypothetical protein U5O15_03430 [Candidatus Krumholzibacteriota bacterium]|nr:hypothetical protein [Candidatus Krumholzibacteriota bacterium]
MSVSLTADDGYMWPMTGNAQISSTFSEYREGHYHAGIDIRCFGRVGIPCIAVSGGYVKRIKVQPAGYGRALYLRLFNGKTAVYAHLHSFDAALDSLQYYKMLESGNNWSDMFLRDGIYRFERGDTLAFAGWAGTKAPHLHFEIRGSAGNPINPLLNIYEVPDKAPPIISALEVIPLEYGSRTGKDYSSEIKFFRAKETNLYENTDTLQLDGVFGFGVSAWDEQSVGGYKMGPFSIELFVDGNLLYRIENRTFSYGQSGEIDYEFDIYDDSWTDRFNLLFRKKGNSRSDRAGNGVICSDSSRTDLTFLKKGLHRGELIVSDSSGNKAKALFNFALHDYPRIQTAKKLDNAYEAVVSSIDLDGGTVDEKLFESLDGGESWNPLTLRDTGKYANALVSKVKSAVYKYEVTDDEGASVSKRFASPRPKIGEDMVFSQCNVRRLPEALALLIKTDRILASLPLVEFIGRNRVLSLKVEELKEKLYLARLEYETVENGENLFHIRGRDYRGYEFDDYHAARIVILKSGGKVSLRISDSLRIDLESPSLNGKVPCIVNSVSLQVGTGNGMDMIRAPFNLDFAEDYLFESIKISGNFGDGVGLFRFDAGDSAWRCVGVPEMEGGAVELDKKGTYAYFRDGLPPRLGNFEKTESPSGSGFFKKYIYYIPIEDEGSGVDSYSSKVTWNGEWTVSQWDDIREKLYIPVPSSRSRGKVSLRVEIGDRVGNIAVKDFEFIVE